MAFIVGCGLTYAYGIIGSLPGGRPDHQPHRTTPIVATAARVPVRCRTISRSNQPRADSLVRNPYHCGALLGRPSWATHRELMPGAEAFSAIHSTLAGAARGRTIDRHDRGRGSPPVVAGFARCRRLGTDATLRRERNTRQRYDRDDDRTNGRLPQPRGLRPCLGHCPDRRDSSRHGRRRQRLEARRHIQLRHDSANWYAQLLVRGLGHS